MSCFIAPTTAAIIATGIKKKIPSHYHIEWLMALLWGGAVWLIPEHIYHGEVVFYPPFFTAGFHEIVSEVLHVGVPMTLAAIALWLGALALERSLKTKTLQPNFASLMILGALVMVAVDTLLA